MHAGSPVVVTVSASDPDAPPQVNFSLETAPAGATIDPGTGTIQWTPGLAEADTTQTFTVHG